MFLTDLVTFIKIVMRGLQKEGNYTRAIDWWSIGVVLFEMLLGRLPFSAPTRPDLFARILTHDPLASLSILNHPTSTTVTTATSQHLPSLFVSQPAYALLSHLLRKDPRERLDSFAAAKSHVFFANIDWDRLGRRELEPPFKPFLDSISPSATSTSCLNESPVRYFESEFTRQPIELTPPLSRASTAFLNINHSVTGNLFDSFSYYGSSAGPSTNASSMTSSRSSLASHGFASNLPSDR